MSSPNDRNPPGDDAATLSEAGREIVGTGESATVLRLRRGAVVKLFFAHVERHTAEREFAGSAAARSLGLCVARPIKIVRVGNRHGLIMDHLVGAVVLRKVAKSPVGMTLALFKLALWQSRMHRTSVVAGALPPTGVVLAQRIATSVAGARGIAAARAMLTGTTDDDRLCHGDLHLGNMIDTPAGLATIDWAKATIGPPEADAARSELLIRYGKYGRFMRRVPPVRIMRHVSAEWYLACYCLMSGRRRADVMRWRLPVAVGWMQGQGTMFVPGLQRAIDRMARRGR
ncbi:phosphotransferase family protein [Sphingomonas sp. R86521]|uniref:phosphotransferase family protein n=1 Tax=Sphingomonas sp. R86521 TaxID=3093860 RepID=UPI0036D3A28A